MVVWSAIRPTLFNITTKIGRNGVLQRPMSDHRIFPYTPTRFQWTKFKDLFHLYLFAGAIPLGLVILYANIFIGPGTLTEIPEDYVPQYWEYQRHPITRFMTKYIFTNPQQDYEKYLHYIFEQDEKMRIRKLEKQIKKKMSERHDYQAYYYRPVLGKYHRASKEAADSLEALRGD